MLNNTDKIYFGLLGGLGDIIWGYLKSPEWKRLNAYRCAYPKARIKAIVISHNRQAAELLRFNPYLDEIDFRYPKREMRDKKWSPVQVLDQYSDGFIHYKGLADPKKVDKEQVLHLLPREKKIVKELSDCVVVHPFASLPDRIPSPAEKYIPIIDDFINKGKKVVVLGNSYTKSFGDYETYQKEEVFDYKRANLFNLVGKTNARVATAITLKASEFVGTWSCYGVTAWLASIKATIITNDSQLNGCNKLHESKYKNHHKDDIIVTPKDIF